MATFLTREDINHLDLENPNAYLATVGLPYVPGGVYNIQRNGEFVGFNDAGSLEALREFLATGITTGSNGEKFIVQAVRLVVCELANGEKVSYDLCPDNSLYFDDFLKA